MIQTAPKNQRLHIGIFGRRNVGKSSLLNALTNQYVSIVSDVAGTTTDPVEKPMELLPIGPVLFIDTAGIDDEGILGELRKERTEAALKRVDLALIVLGTEPWGEFEEFLCEELKKFSVSIVIVQNKNDLPHSSELKNVQTIVKNKFPIVSISAAKGKGISDLKSAMLKATPDGFLGEQGILSDLVPPGECVILVVPIDKEAPKGRLILPQVQSIRDALDNDSYCMVVKERELKRAMERLTVPPALVVTDSQAFLKVAADVPNEIPLTSFSILFARRQGDLNEFVRGTMAIEKLKPGSRVLIAEGCSHHPIAEDIGSVKIPRWLTQYVGGKLEIEFLRGHDFPSDVSKCDLIIHCGACMSNRKEMLNRIYVARQNGVPITNYGLTISYTLGIFERALKPFPAALELYLSLKK